MKILCPIDFSNYSISALNYAARLAVDIQAELHVVHVFRVSQVVESFEELKEETYKALKFKIDALINKLPSSFDEKIVNSVLYGSPHEEILKYSKQEDVALIILGSEGNATLANRLLGSVAATIVEKSSTAVLVIPSNEIVEYAPSKILLALDNLELEHETSFELPTMLAKIWNQNIDILHVKKKGETDFPFDPFIGNFLKECLGEIHLVSNEDVGYSMMGFVEKNEYQLLIMVNRQRGFWSSLFNKNHIKEEILRSFVPLLIVPE